MSEEENETVEFAEPLEAAEPEVVKPDPEPVVEPGDPDCGPTWLYKNGDAQIFEGVDVARKMNTGWKDAPSKPRGRPKGS